jgi:hypothetical protein
MRILASKFNGVMKSRGVGDTANAAIVKDYGDGWIEVDTRHQAYPRSKPGLGDVVSSALSLVGITKERVSAVVGGDCGCAKRQAAMNAAGAKYFGLPPGSTAPENKG